MTRKVVRTVLPIAPPEYDQVYVNQLARALDRLIDEVRSANINFQGVGGQGSSNALQEGDIFIGDAGFLRIVTTEDIFSGSFVGTTALGNVTVATS
jgi:hypothetical protein|tara:strand:- start:410 stop:697 length:288 start_codon:yes stop_codon:yes gene_type:complete